MRLIQSPPDPVMGHPEAAERLPAGGGQAVVERLAGDPPGVVGDVKRPLGVVRDADVGRRDASGQQERGEEGRDAPRPPRLVAPEGPKTAELPQTYPYPHPDTSRPEKGPSSGPTAPENTAPQPKNTLDCQVCGACCRTEDNDAFGVELGPTEAAAIRAAYPELADWVTDTHTLSKPLGRHRVCALFRGEFFGPGACAIYSVRPWLCRQFPVGGIFCLAARTDLRLLLKRNGP